MEVINIIALGVYYFLLYLCREEDRTRALEDKL